MAKIKLDHTRLDTPAYIERMREISTALAASTPLAALAPKLAPFNVLVDALADKSTEYEAAVQAAKALLTERETGRVAVDAAARGLASASEAETIDEADLLSGGWHLTSPPTPPGPMPAPQNLTATGGDLEGEVDLQWDPVTGRDAYIAESAASAPGPWTQFYVGNNSSCTATGLNPGQMFYFRARAVGPLGPGPWSDIAQKRAS